MAIELRVPSLGESITQATIGTWLKNEGDAVALDEPVVEVESEKATVALPAPSEGVLRRILKPTGTTVNVGEVIGEMEQRAKPEAPPSRPAPGPLPNGPAAPVGYAGAPPRRSTATPTVPPPSTPTPPSTATPNATPTASAAPTPSAPERGRRLPIPPSARRLLAEHDLAAEGIAGSGKGGQVRKEDVLRALEPAPSGAPPAPPEARGPVAPRPAGAPSGAARERIVPMSPLRRTVARRLVEAQQGAAILTTFNEIDMSRVIAVREKWQGAFQELYGVKLGFMSFFVKASIEALKAFPLVNAEVRGTDIVYKDFYDIGVAVGGGKGLVVPVVRDADRLSFAEVELRIAELAKRAHENRITMDDLEGGTFTISNGGIYGSLLSTPILNPPQSAILGLHKIEKRPVAGEGDVVVVRPMMYVALSYDHRIVDGREAVSFLVRVKECIEDPDRMLLEV